MILLRLFLTFLKIGSVAFGGGYVMIPLMRDECLTNGWLTEAELLDFIAVSESTPGPIASSGAEKRSGPRPSSAWSISCSINRAASSPASETTADGRA